MKLLASRTPVEPSASLNAEERFRSAQARLLAAQQEKAEAADEFLAARAALRGGLKTPRSAAGRATESKPWESPAAWAGA